MPNLNTAKYYTNFGFKGYELKDFHCTHLYLGDLNDVNVLAIIELINNFFIKKQLTPFLVRFDSLEKFNNRKVLLGDAITFDNCFKILFNEIETICRSLHDFKPHVSVKSDITCFEAEIDRYVVVKKQAGKIYYIKTFEFINNENNNIIY